MLLMSKMFIEPLDKATAINDPDKDTMESIS